MRILLHEDKSCDQESPFEGHKRNKKPGTGEAREIGRLNVSNTGIQQPARDISEEIT